MPPFPGRMDRKKNENENNKPAKPVVYKPFDSVQNPPLVALISLTFAHFFFAAWREETFCKLERPFSQYLLHAKHSETGRIFNGTSPPIFGQTHFVCNAVTSLKVKLMCTIMKNAFFLSSLFFKIIGFIVNLKNVLNVIR